MNISDSDKSVFIYFKLDDNRPNYYSIQSPPDTAQRTEVILKCQCLQFIKNDIFCNCLQRMKKLM